MRALGIDIGTTNLKVIVLDLHSAAVVERLSLPNSFLGSSFLQDPDTIVAKLDTMLASLGHRYDCIGITGQVHGILYTDACGRAVSPLYTWLDKRAAERYGDSTVQAMLAQKTGRTIAPGYGLLTHYVNKVRNEVPATAAAFAGIIEHVAAHLIGQRLEAADPCSLSAFGAFDPVTNRCDRAVLDEVLGHDFPYMQVAAPFTLAGCTASGIPVAYPVGDNQAAFHALVADPGNGCLVSIGTSGQISVHKDDGACPAGMELRPYPAGGYLVVGATLSAGKSYERLMVLFKEAASSLAGHPIDDEQVFAMMQQAAEAARSKEGFPLRVSTALNGTRTDPAQRGTIEGIDLDNLTVGNLVNAFVDAIVGELMAFTRDLGASFDPISTIIATGNAIDKNDLFSASLSRLSGRRIVKASVEDAAAVGAALLAAQASALIDSSVRDGLVAGWTQEVKHDRN